MQSKQDPCRFAPYTLTQAHEKALAPGTWACARPGYRPASLAAALLSRFATSPVAAAVLC